MRRAAIISAVTFIIIPIVGVLLAVQAPAAQAK